MRSFAAALVPLLLAGTALAETPPSRLAEAEARDEAAAKGKAQWGSFGVDTASADKSVKPGDDFWSYVNGTWAKTVEIPADRGALSQVQRLNDLSGSQVRTIIEEMEPRRASLSGDDARVADYYATLIDQAAIDAKGAAPLMADVATIRAAKDRAALAAEMGKAARQWQGTPPLGRMPRYFPAPVEVGIGQDPKNPTSYVVGMGQGGLGMPNRDYYLKDDADSVKAQAAYRDHVAAMLTLAGVPKAATTGRAKAVYDFERAIAEAHWPLADSRDADKTYNPMTLAELKAKAPGLDWDAYLGAAGLGGRPTYIVGETGAVTGIAKLWAATPLPVLQDWMTVRIAKDRALALPKAFQDAEFAFSGGVLGGATEAPARWSQAIELTATAMTDAVSKPYIERHFPPATKAAMDDLVANVIAAMDRRLAGLSWMTPETKVKARAKLAAFTPMIGYPDTWRSYDGLQVVKGDAYGNLKRAGAFDWDRSLARIDRPVDRREWWMMPITANAYASFQNNQIVFPAGYLQPPHFDPYADPAVNYGAIGYVIGHEISHHFDDQGSKFDPEGRLATWWTPADIAAFDARKAKLVAQYDGYEALPGLNIRGQQTLGENIADNAGLAIAYDAYQLSLKGKPAPVIDGTTGDQRFFMGRAQVNKVAFREAELRKSVLSGVHSPSKWRTWAVRNHDAWYKAFDVKPGDKLYLAPADRVKIWE
ncbi:M13 family metallopeptidase [Allosphingosinicella indica]|uniref:Putative endopeptidase n=1 Tax=Allosphingosinicella indica TaxID=941907 RepID=A0A1X7G0A9_9SPHN|nr:M13 family metallopeptidase [Allosphingosinicella indica]SMF61781.1 putative endopeptidase [Allosphingosinicella indica]